MKNKWYNAEGKQYMIKWVDSPDASVYKDNWIPIEVIKEYDEWMLAVVLTHKNPIGYTLSWPYRIGINKSQILFGEILIKEGGWLH